MGATLAQEITNRENVFLQKNTRTTKNIRNHHKQSTTIHRMKSQTKIETDKNTITKTHRKTTNYQNTCTTTNQGKACA